MTDCEKLLQQARNAPNNLRFVEVCRLAECYGFALVRQEGSHCIYKCSGTRQLMNFQDVKGKAKPYQVKQLLNAIDEIQAQTGFNQELSDE